MRFNCQRAEHIRTHAPDAKLITYKEPIGFVLNHWDLRAEIKLVKQQACQGSGSIVRAFFDVHSTDQIKQQNLSNPSSLCESGVLRLECRKMQQNKSASSAMKSSFAASD